MKSFYIFLFIAIASVLFYFRSYTDEALEELLQIDIRGATRIAAGRVIQASDGFLAQRRSEKAPIALKPGFRIYSSQVLTTQAGARGQIEFRSGFIIEFEPHTAVMLGSESCELAEGTIEIRGVGKEEKLELIVSDKTLNLSGFDHIQVSLQKTGDTKLIVYRKSFLQGDTSSFKVEDQTVDAVSVLQMGK